MKMDGWKVTVFGKKPKWMDILKLKVKNFLLNEKKKGKISMEEKNPANR
jgi:hypothetical protein